MQKYIYIYIWYLIPLCLFWPLSTSQSAPFLYQWSPLLRLRREAWHSARTRPMVPVPWAPRVSWDFGRLLLYKTPGFQPAKGKTTVYFLWGFSCSDGIHGRVDILRRYMKVPLSISSVPFYSIFANDHLYNHNIITQLPNTIPQHDPKWRYIYHSNGVWQHHWAWWWLNNSSTIWIHLDGFRGKQIWSTQPTWNVIMAQQLLPFGVCNVVWLQKERTSMIYSNIHTHVRTWYIRKACPNQIAKDSMIHQQSGKHIPGHPTLWRLNTFSIVVLIQVNTNVNA